MIRNFGKKGSFEKVNLLELMQQEGIFLPADCGGIGRCGKCRVRFTEGAPEACEGDLEIFSAEEIAEGWRLACMAEVSEPFSVCWDQGEDEILAETGFYAGKEAGAGSEPAGSEGADAGADGEAGAGGACKVAVDIGTTTIAVSLVDGAGRILQTVTSVNHQRSFGADVISRMQASNEGKGPQLMKSVNDDLDRMIRQLGADPETVETIIAGNTTMEHLLQGLPCDSLGVAPYTPVDISMHRVGNRLILPGISTFVGADIVSGIIACGMDQSDKINILVDLGTNGEMAIGSRDRILVTSTAAGPAFEGGNISCGVAGIPGAVDTVTITDGEASYTTIGGKDPVGLCGTGVLEVTYELLKNELVDETGLMDDEYFDDGYPVAEGVIFENKDVREIQLAKAAIRAGLECLIEAFGADYDDIGQLWLAGGFGQKINLEKAAGIGLLPEELLEKCTAVGNSSLAGAVQLAGDPGLADRFEAVSSSAEEISLADSVAFNNYYMEYMFFPEQE